MMKILLKFDFLHLLSLIQDPFLVAVEIHTKGLIYSHLDRELWRIESTYAEMGEGKEIRVANVSIRQCWLSVYQGM